MTMEQLRTPATSSAQFNPQLLDIENSILEIQREFTEIITTERSKFSWPGSGSIAGSIAEPLLDRHWFVSRA